MKLTPKQRKVAIRAVKVAIEARKLDKKSYTVSAPGHPQFGRIVDGDHDMTDEVERDLSQFKYLLGVLRRG